MYVSMLAWLNTADSEKATLTRLGQIMAEGETPTYPPKKSAGFLLFCLESAGIYQNGFGGPEPLTATELRNWSEGSGVGMGSIDFQDILDASRDYVRFCNEYTGVDAPSPWLPDMKLQDEVQAMAAQERAWDIVMGIS